MHTKAQTSPETTLRAKIAVLVRKAHPTKTVFSVVRYSLEGQADTFNGLTIHVLD